MSDQGTKDRKVVDRKIADRKVAPKQPPKVLVKSPRSKEWWLNFETWTFSHEVTRLLFKSGRLPSGAELKPRSKLGGDPTMEWVLTWEDRLYDHLTEFGEKLARNVERITSAAMAGDEFPEDIRKREAYEAQRREELRRERQTFLPALNMTPEEALRTLKPGAYVTAPHRKIIALGRLQPWETFPPNVDWLQDYRDGYFVWVGFSRSGISHPGLQLQMRAISSHQPWWKDAIWFLKEGLSLKEAVKKFDERWNELYFMTVAAFALSLTSAPGTGGRKDVGETLFASAQKDASRMVGREVRPEKKFGNFASKIDPIEAANVGIVATSVIMEGAQIIEDIKKKKEEQELQSIGDSITKLLADKFKALPQKQIEKELGTGQLGEAIIKKTLELRGYAVVELQNASGQGVDLVAVKVKGDLIVYVEVKSSIADYPGKLSAAQKNTHEFIRNRLERVVAHEGLYKNVSQQAVDIAKALIAEIDAGRPIGGIRVTVQGLSRGTALITVKFNHWKPSVPKATAIKPHK